MDRELLELHELQKKIAEQNSILEQYFDTLNHSNTVYDVAFKLASRINEMQQKKAVSIDLLELMCFAHDTGRMVTGSKASKELKEGILHGYEGSKIIRDNKNILLFRNDETLEKIARCCQTHINGAGLSSKAKADLKLKYPDKPYCDFTDISLEEKLVGFSDMLVFAERNMDYSFSPTIVDLETAYDKVLKFNPNDPEYPAKLDDLVGEIYESVTSTVKFSNQKRPTGISLKDIGTTIYTLSGLHTGKHEYSSYEVEKLASLLKNMMMEYVLSGNKNEIRLDSFTKKDDFTTHDYILFMTPFGLKECYGALVGMESQYADPEDWNDSFYYIPFDNFEKIIQRYGVDNKKLDNYGNKCSLKRYCGVCEDDSDSCNHPEIELYATNDKSAIEKIHNKAHGLSGKDYNYIVEAVFQDGRIVWKEF